MELFVPFLSLEKKVKRNFKKWAVSGEFRGCLSPAVQILSLPPSPKKSSVPGNLKDYLAKS